VDLATATDGWQGYRQWYWQEEQVGAAQQEFPQQGDLAKAAG
jgi:hypothetical protein